jgi:hypothetical protein
VPRRGPAVARAERTAATEPRPDNCPLTEVRTTNRVRGYFDADAPESALP